MSSLHLCHTYPFRILIILIILGIVPSVIVTQIVINTYADRAIALRTENVKNISHQDKDNVTLKMMFFDWAINTQLLSNPIVMFLNLKKHPHQNSNNWEEWPNIP